MLEAVLWERGMSAIWGVAAVGFRWMAVKMERSNKIESIVDWKNDVLDFESSEIMRNLAHTIKVQFEPRTLQYCRSRTLSAL